MAVLFVLMPAGRSPDELFAGLAPDLAARAARLPRRSYPPADDRRHLLSLVRAGRDRAATQWLRGLVLCVAGGAALGLLTAATLASAFGMFGGLVGAACAFGLVVGAFLGGFTAAMTGTERARPELVRLSGSVCRGDVLVTFAASADDAVLIDALLRRCDELGIVACRRD